MIRDAETLQVLLDRIGARTAARSKSASGVSAFILEAGTLGIRIGKPDRKRGQRGAHTCCAKRFASETRLFRLYEGTSQIQQRVIARQMMRDAAR